MGRTSLCHNFCNQQRICTQGAALPVDTCNGPLAQMPCH